MKHPPGQFVWLSYNSHNSAKGAEFYASLFGWSVQVMNYENTGDSHFFTASGMMFGASQDIPKEIKGGEAWVPFISHTDLDKGAQLVKQNGGTVCGPVFEIPKVGHALPCQDTSQSPFMLFLSHPDTAEGHIQHGKKGQLCWMENMSLNGAKDSQFYCHVIGFKAMEQQMPHMEDPYRMLGMNENDFVCGIFHCPPELQMKSGTWVPYFVVDSVVKSTKRLAELGGKNIVPPQPIPNMGSFSVNLDPNGAYFGCFEPDPTAARTA